MVKLRILLLDIVKPLKPADACSIHRFELVTNLARLNHEFYVISMRNLNFSKFKNIKCHYISNKNKFFLYASYLATFLYLALFKQFDIVYTRNPTLGFLACLFFRKIKGNAVVYEINGIAADERKLIRDELMRHEKAKPMSIFTKRIDDRILKFMGTYTLKNASFIISVTEGIKEHLIEFYDIDRKRICVIENGANTDLFRPMDRKKVKKELKFNPDAKYVCFVGYFAPWQGVEYLVQSAPLILKEIPNVRFIIVGYGQMKEELINLAVKTGVSDKFIFTGEVPYEEVPKYINTSDICVAPFIKERNMRIGLSPLKIYEYAACGNPVVSSRIPNLEFIEEQTAGILVEPENPEQLAKAIIKLLKDEKLREEMGRNGREYVVKNHSWASVAKKVAEVCESAISEHKNKGR